MSHSMFRSGLGFRWIVASAVFLFAVCHTGLTCAAGPPTLALYDDFSAGYLDPNKWSSPTNSGPVLDVVRAVNNGQLEMIIHATSSGGPQTRNNDLQFVNPTINNAFTADAKLIGHDEPNGSVARMRLRGSFYNSTMFSGSGATGDVSAQVFIEGGTTGLAFKYQVFVCGNSNCSQTFVVSDAVQFGGTPSLNAAVTLGIAWDGTTFTFKAGPDTATYDPLSHAPKNSAHPDPYVLDRALGAQLGFNTVVGALALGGEAYVQGAFDNVRTGPDLVPTNLALYDDFSGGGIDPTKWTNNETQGAQANQGVRELIRTVKNGALNSALVYQGSASTSQLNRVLFVNQNIVTAAQVAVTINDFDSSGGNDVQARALTGSFFNDGTSTAPNDNTGNIGAHARIRSVNGGPLTAEFTAHRCLDASCLTFLIITPGNAPVTLGTVNLHETHNLYLYWDGTLFHYGMDLADLALAQTFDPASVSVCGVGGTSPCTPSPNNPPRGGNRREIRTTVLMPASPSKPGYINATFSNVRVNAEAAQIPRLGRFYQKQLNGTAVSAGVGLMGTGSGTINLGTVLTGSTIEKAFLYWTTFGNAPFTGSFTFGGTTMTPAMYARIGQADGPNPSIFQSYAYRADVTTIVNPSTSTYAISGLPDGTSGRNTHGASLVVVYRKAGDPSRVVTIHDGLTLLGATLQYYETTMTGFTSATPLPPTPPGAHLIFIVGGGMPGAGNYAGMNGVNLYPNPPNMTSPFIGAAGAAWDDGSTNTPTPSGAVEGFDVTVPTGAGATMASPAVSSNGVSPILWVAAVSSVIGQQTGQVDFNGDGKPDLLWQHVPSGDVYLWAMDGTTQTGGAYLAQGMGPWKVVGTADFNGDGKPDLLWQDATSGDVYLWTMNGTALTGGTYVAQGMGPWKVVATGDFCGADGKPDLVWQHETSGDVYLWCMNGTTVTGGTYLAQGMGLWKIVATADLNGDGKPDLLWQHATSGDVYVWFMNGTAQTGGTYLAQGMRLWRVAGTADLTGDGKTDLLWQHATTGDVYLWTMNGTTQTGAAYLAQGMGTWKVVGPK